MDSTDPEKLMFSWLSLYFHGKLLKVGMKLEEVLPLTIKVIIKADGVLKCLPPSKINKHGRVGSDMRSKNPMIKPGRI